jgi:rare lipoprotein A
VFLMANNKPLDDNALTCALPKETATAWSMKFGQQVRVTNLANGRTVLLTYTDRGPGRKSRSRGTIIDLTPAAFCALGGKLKEGRIKITVERSSR